jgi:CubicO group peptidase (beta-lactamase class C family)
MSDSKILYNVWIQFEPGVMSFFSVFDASVAGAVIESAAGSYYKDYVTTALLPALGMTRSVFMDDQVKADPDLAFGEKALIPTMTTNALYRPIAGLYLSITDAARLAEFLLNGNTAVMSDSTRQELVKPRMPGSPAPEASGLAYTHAMGMEGIYDWLKQQQLPYAVHSDDYIILGEGYASEMVLIPSRGFALITLSNATAGLVTTSTKQAVLRTILSLDDVAPFPYGNWEPEYEKYEGTYERPSYATPVVVSQIDGGLHLTKPSSVDCTPGYAQTFLCKPPFQESVWFVRIDGGPAEYLATSKWVARRSDAADAGADQ